MIRRWRGRFAGLAILAVLVLPVAAAAGGSSALTLVVRGPEGELVARVALPDGEFTLRYRNSLYGSIAEEGFVVTPDGRIALRSLAADELAVLEEYYAIDRPARRSAGPRDWVAVPARAVVLDDLLVAATDLGRRTLLVEGQSPIELWRHVDDGAPSVRLEVELP